MKRCTSFYENCRAEVPDTIAPGTFCEIRRSDANLYFWDHSELLDELSRVQDAIVWHCDIESIEERPRNLNDDRELYHIILPEMIPADFRLPLRREFLVSQNEHSGCPAFWASHTGCGDSCNLHAWGPCLK